MSPTSILGALECNFVFCRADFICLF